MRRNEFIKDILCLRWNSDIVFDLLHNCSPEKLSKIWLQLVFIIISGSKLISRIFITVNFKCTKFHTIWCKTQALICGTNYLGVSRTSQLEHCMKWCETWHNVKLKEMKIRLISLQPEIITYRGCDQSLLNFSGEQLCTTSNTMSEFHRSWIPLKLSFSGVFRRRNMSPGIFTNSFVTKVSILGDDLIQSIIY